MYSSITKLCTLQNCFIYTVSQPVVEVSLNNSDTLYAGTGLTLTCTITLDPNVDNNEDVIMTWSGPRDIPGERYLVMMANESDGTYTIRLVISPLSEDDDGQYICSVTIEGGSNVLEATGTNAVNITVLGKL